MAYDTNFFPRRHPGKDDLSANELVKIDYLSKN